MSDPGRGNDVQLIAELNDLLQLDHDAVEAYTVAIDTVRDGGYRETLAEFRTDHKRHIEEIAAIVRARGGLATELPHPTGALKLAVQTAGGLASDDALLLAFKAVEGQVRDKYQRFARKSYPDDVADVVARAAEDEEKHYRWTEETLRSRGVGEGTLPHGLASLVETIHKALADPIEAAGRTVMRAVGSVVGTTGERGGSAAPSPTEAANAAMSAAEGAMGAAEGAMGAAEGAMNDVDAMSDRGARPSESNITVPITQVDGSDTRAITDNDPIMREPPMPGAAASDEGMPRP